MERDRVGLQAESAATRASRSAGAGDELRWLLDPADYSKSVDKVLELLSMLGCEVEFSVRPRSA